ncbi:MAG: Orotate phosphoribosyltransferase [uncultured Rubrobacteraceae bacterium]|uniref:Orotate phosphoribosyltransferase n=1 Tax=uncultured Rubrobacteraceae bacterium TaxID=349277 RepID=A0A6J4R1V9_9ACTN|nr:MAG: Orotate phosphoribosyltransferase [uncultured Rubrobacteraceae bacterium]
MSRGPDDLAARVREAALLEGDFVLSSGKRSSFYVDKYLFSTEPALLRDIAAALAGTLPPGVDRLAGVELGAVPLVVATALQTGLPYVIVRKAVKEYGGSAGEAVEGVVERGERVVLLEDVVSTGTQAIKAARELDTLGVEVVKVVAVLDRREEPGGELGEFSFQSLLRMDELRVGKRD